MCSGHDGSLKRSGRSGNAADRSLKRSGMWHKIA